MAERQGLKVNIVYTCWVGGGDPHIQCFMFGGDPIEQADDREGRSSTVFGINTEEQVLQSQVEHSRGIHWGASDNCFQRVNLVGNCD